MSEKKDTLLQKINNGIVDMVTKILGEKAAETVKDAQGKIKGMSSDALKKALELTDSVIETLKLKDNEQVKDGKKKVEEFLKDQGLIKE